jgi:MerR family transcriptional regulator, light-induced transcriptional regulator
MNDRAAVRPITISIAAVERDTGLSKDTLRVWERRYGFPTPERDSFGERAYPLEQVEKLRLVRRLLDAGHRPGRIVRLGIDDLQQLAETIASTPARIADDDSNNLRGFMELVKTHDVDGLRRAMSQTVLRIGLARFVTEMVAPMNAMIGDAWMRGQVEVFEEHMYTESVQVVLRGALATVPPQSSRPMPRVLLTTIPQEPHGLGILMAEALFALEGCKCLSLGVQTPIMDIALAAAAHRADIVALSFTASLNANLVMDSLGDLRQKLPASTAIWAGGQCPVIHRRDLVGIVALADLDGIAGELQRWGEQQPQNAV